MNNIEIFDNAIITPTYFRDGSYTGAVYDQNGNLYKKSVRNDLVFDLKNPSQIDTNEQLQYIRKPSIYMGHLNHHYGHFLLESLVRMWPLFEEKLDFKYIIFNKCFYQPGHIKDYKTNWIYKFCEAFDVLADNIIILEKVTKFNKLYVPDTSFNLPFWWSDSDNNFMPSKLSKVYDAMVRYSIKRSNEKVTPLPRNYKYIYIARPSHCTRIKNHKKAEEIFQKHGFEILRTELYSIYDQIYIYNNAEILASIEGTGSHNSVFLKNNKTLITINSLRSHETSAQDIVNQTNNTKEYKIAFKSTNNDNNLDLQHLKYELDLIMEIVNKELR